jgi:hypothetical protein
VGRSAVFTGTSAFTRLPRRAHRPIAARSSAHWESRTRSEPPHFVNNFSALSAELIDELDATLAPAPLDQKMRGNVGELTQMLKSNLDQVVQHGKRADSIVKNMLQHSREGSGEHGPADKRHSRREPEPRLSRCQGRKGRLQYHLATQS